MRTVALILSIITLCLVFPSYAKRAATPTERVAAVLALPDDQLDYARAKLTFDGIVDPAAAGPAVAAELDHLTAEAQALAGPNADDRRKLAAVRHVIYDSRPWNGGRPFSYDLADPDGQILRDELIATYLATRRGTCVSMPALFLILADRLGVPVQLALAPGHFFVQYTDGSGRRFNLETTSGGHVARDEWIRQNMPMSDRAIESGIYLRPLSKREAVAEMALVVVGYLHGQQRYQEMADLGELILKNAPRSTEAMVKVGTAYAHMIDAEFGRYRVGEDDYSRIPANLKPRFLMMVRRNRQAFEQADALGWRDPRETTIGAHDSRATAADSSP